MWLRLVKYIPSVFEYEVDLLGLFFGGRESYESPSTEQHDEDDDDDDDDE